jgi:uncharacterized damage-inducible protein DinB
MAIKDALLPEFDHEMATTRRLLERVPEAKFDWKPHDKSMSLGELAGHVANIPRWLAVVLESDSFDLATGGDDARPKAPAPDMLVSGFDERVAAGRAILAARTDAEMMARWALKQGTHEMFAMPRVSAVRYFVMNHLIHHRGQLSVYLRLNNVPVPPIYGPSADER